MKPFFQIVKINRNIIIRKNSLRAYLKRQYSVNNPSKHNIISEKKVSFGTFKASMTVEAALLVPIFLFLMLNLLCGIRFIEMQSRILAASHQIQRQVMVYGYGTQKADFMENLGITGEWLSIGFLKEMIKKEIKADGGAQVDLDVSKIMLSGSDINSEKGTVNLQVSYLAKTIFPQIGGVKIYLGTNLFGHMFSGYRGDEEESNTSDHDEMVFITKEGTVYHCNRNCRYLTLSISEVEKEEVSKKRNMDGERYRSCDMCVSQSIDCYYITDYGTSYHGSLMCPGLKRTIYTIKRSEVGNRGCCVKCGTG